jgi:hypothetical protein
VNFAKEHEFRTEKMIRGFRVDSRISFRLVPLTMCRSALILLGPGSFGCHKSGIGVLKRVLTLTVQQQLSSDFDWHQSC